MKSIFLILLFSLGVFATYAQIVDSLQRHIQLQGASNFRDLGGYKNIYGEQVKWGQVYRSADLSKLTNQDFQKLDELDLTLVCDLRGPSEIKSSPDRLPQNITYLNLPAGSENLPSSLSYAQLNADSLMMNIYTNTSFLKAKYKPMFEQLVNLSEGKSMVFHCTAGKDRTGLGAALFLAALDVDRETIIQDYLATNHYWKATKEKMTVMMLQAGMNESKINALLGANQSYIEAFLDKLVNTYGSMDKFFTWGLEISLSDRAVLKARYLQK